MVQNHSQRVDLSASEDTEWDRALNSNLSGIARLSRAALPHLRNSDSVAIVNTCSIAATAGLPQRALYSASKGAVVYLASPLSDSVAGTSMAVDSGMQGLRLRPKELVL
ncbi:SDR family NAD(P)-dependent oxidoreductase [Arthrobacter rhombi]|uniref:SDR family NAD(P)-dependent oxidoreductase n=1 Tax=Arthrobacter rhombi TaxID=71253 RepID=UPI003FD5C826